jgi:hypothetical protein
MDSDWTSFQMEQDASPESQLLAFTLLLRGALKAKSQGIIAIDLPRQVYQSITPDTFRSIFSDLLLERDPGIEARLQIRVVDGPVFGYGRRASEDR